MIDDDDDIDDEADDDDPDESESWTPFDPHCPECLHPSKRRHGHWRSRVASRSRTRHAGTAASRNGRFNVRVMPSRRSSWTSIAPRSPRSRVGRLTETKLIENLSGWNHFQHEAVCPMLDAQQFNLATRFC